MAIRVPSRRLAAAVVGLPLAVLLAGGCGGGADETGSTVATTPARNGPALPQGSESVDLDPSDFTADIDNEFWPMTPGTRWVYREVDEDGAELEVIVTVSSETREIANGVTARVVRDSVREDGNLVEDTIDWYAQDSAGNVWYLGEDTAEFEDGEITTRGGSFEAGVDGALPGVIMPAEPVDGLAYRQEYYAGEAEDNGGIVSLGEMVDVVAGHYDDVLVTRDTITIEPDVLEYKFYAPGVGPVLTLGLSGGLGREELTELTTVTPEVAAAAGTAPLGEAYD
ncbi:hypothetical protein ACFP3Q_04110 [Nocardioides sp. GCM10027113]|uniref:hypothetical protein n=1 Tax=unclassified Nocardioides TaxID=2615069 RepID=UPI003624262B